MTALPPIDDTDISATQAIDISGIAIERGFALKRSGRELVGPCPHCGGQDRFAINITRQLFNCRGCAGKGRGAIALVRWLDGCDFPAAVRTLIRERSAQVNSKPVPAPKNFADYDRRQHAKAAWLWSQRHPIAGGIAEKYLREVRGIACPLPPTLAFLPPLKRGHHPAMIAAFGLCDEVEPGTITAPREVVAVHLTLLRADGSGKAEISPDKITVGSPCGKPIAIAPSNDLLGLAIAEGIEDALSVHQATGLGAWAAGSAPHMDKVGDHVPGYVDCVTINAHADKAGRDAANKLAARLRERGIEVTIEGLAA